MGLPKVSTNRLDANADPNCRRCKGTGVSWYEDADGDVDRDVCPCVIDHEDAARFGDGRLVPGSDECARLEVVALKSLRHGLNKPCYSPGYRRWMHVYERIVARWMQRVAS